MNRLTVLLGVLAAFVLRAADDVGRRVIINDHQLYVHCSGTGSKLTVVLLNGLGGSLELWKQVQSGVEKFANVCSYDRAGEGHSAKMDHLQTPGEVVDDLSRLLESENALPPYILVGWSLGGVYARSFAQRFPGRTAGIVLVDSSHEEQFNHYVATAPAMAERFATQDGRFDRDQFLRASGQLAPGKHLEWRLDVPLIVLEHKRLAVEARTEQDRLAVDWHDLQVDLASRSKFGKLIETHSGHMIATEQPEIVIDSIHDVINQSDAIRRSAAQH